MRAPLRPPLRQRAHSLSPPNASFLQGNTGDYNQGTGNTGTGNVGNGNDGSNNQGDVSSIA